MGTEVATVDTTVPLSQIRTNTDPSELAESGDAVTIATGGLYEVELSTSMGSNGASDWSAEVWIEVDGGEVPGSRRYVGTD